MKHSIHPNQFPSLRMTFEENDESSEGMSAALRFLEGIDYEEDALRQRRRRRNERAVAGHLTAIRGRVLATR